MKQKYSIVKDSSSGSIFIKEFAELDKEMFSLIFEESYDGKKVKGAVKEGKNALISLLRTPNLYPIAEYADKIADSVILLVEGKSPADEPIELVFDDINLMLKEEQASEESESDDSVEVDSLLDDESEE